MIIVLNNIDHAFKELMIMVSGTLWSCFWKWKKYLL